jgi:hypothetical protein
MTGKWIEEGGIRKVDGLYLKMGWNLRSFYLECRLDILANLVYLRCGLDLKSDYDWKLD